jgi:hypothetical protein
MVCAVLLCWFNPSCFSNEGASIVLDLAVVLADAGAIGCCG